MPRLRVRKVAVQWPLPVWGGPRSGDCRAWSESITTTIEIFLSSGKSYTDDVVVGLIVCIHRAQ